MVIIIIMIITIIIIIVIVIIIIIIIIPLNISERQDAGSLRMPCRIKAQLCVVKYHPRCLSECSCHSVILSVTKRQL